AGALLAELDACVAGGAPQTGRRALRAGDLPVGRWRWVPVVFEHPGGAYETRVLWAGHVPFAVDAVALWRIGKP
ncbi:MAG: hypothetical protein GXP31_17515, partial [Kiritimatiellaeota bacterium]|nr:hypothetical protein [Kiritimatiellota bacterium]